MLVIGSVFSRVFRPVINDVDWNPSAIFYGGEPGVWFDPSDLTTLFQDDLGTTPVTAPNQTVGLMLDKSKGLALGSELRALGSIITSGAPASVATYNTGTGVGTSFRTDAANTSGVLLDVPDTDNLIFLVDLEVGSGTVQIRTAGPLGTVLATVSVGRTTLRLSNPTANTLCLCSGTNGAGNAFTLHSIRELAGNHATQAISTRRPTYQVDSNGKPYLLFDGVDDGMVTGTITPATDKVQVFAGVRKLSDAAIGMIAEVSANVISNNGSFWLGGPISATASNYQFATKGTIIAAANYTNAAIAAPITNVITGVGDISGDLATLRINGAQVATLATDQGTGNYLAYPLYIGRRGGTTLPYNGRLYSLIVRFGANLTTGQITSTENWVNGKTGAY